MPSTRPPASPAAARKTASGKTISPVAPTVALKICMVQAVVMGLGLLVFSETFAGKVGLTSYLSCEGKGKKCKAPSSDDMKMLYTMMNWMGIGMMSWFAILSPIIRTGHAGTQKLVCLAMGLVRVPMTYKSVAAAMGAGFSPPIPMVLLNVVVVGVCFAASVGVEKPSLPSWSKMSNVGKAGLVTSAITLLQIVPIIFTPSKHLSNYGYDIGTMHPDVQTMMLMIIPIWGLMGLAAVLMRLSIIVVGDKASMSASNRGAVMTYAVMMGYAASMKTSMTEMDSTKMTIQIMVFFVYMMALHFAQIFDDKKRA
jgi:hypothetical protein